MLAWELARLEDSRRFKVERANRLAKLYSLTGATRRKAFIADAQLCAGSFVYWCNNYGWVRAEKVEGVTDEALIDIPFVLWPSQVELSDWLDAKVERGETALVTKSRELGVSWLILHKRYWAWRFHGLSSRFGSRTEDFVDLRGSMDSLFEKLRYIHDRQPPHLKEPKCISAHLVLKNQRNRARIIGESTNENFGRGGRTQVTAIDEFHAVPPRVADAALRATTSVSRSLWLVGTPQGTGHPAHRLREELSAAQVRDMPWTCDPYRPPNFKELMTFPIGRLTDAEFEREYNCSYTAVIGENQIWTIGDVVEYDENDQRWTFLAETARRHWLNVGAWDFGSGPSLLVCLLALIEPRDRDPEPRIWVDDELDWKSEAWYTAAADVRARSAAYGSKKIHFGDPSGIARESDQTSWQAKLRTGGVPLYCLPDWYNSSEGREWMIRETQRLFDSDKIRIHKRCRRLLAAVKEWKRNIDDFMKVDQVNREYIAPRHDVHSHPGMALIYLVGGALAYLRLLNRGAKPTAPAPQRIPSAVEGQFGAVLRGVREGM